MDRLSVALTWHNRLDGAASQEAILLAFLRSLDGLRQLVTLPSQPTTKSAGVGAGAAPRGLSYLTMHPRWDALAQIFQSRWNAWVREKPVLLRGRKRRPWRAENTWELDLQEPERKQERERTFDSPSNSSSTSGPSSGPIASSVRIEDPSMQNPGPIVSLEGTCSLMHWNTQMALPSNAPGFAGGPMDAMNAAQGMGMVVASSMNPAFGNQPYLLQAEPMTHSELDNFLTSTEWLSNSHSGNHDSLVHSRP